VSGRIEAGPPVSLLLHQTEADQRLKAGHKDAAFRKIVFVVKADRFEGHARSPRPEGEGLAQLLDIVTARFRRKPALQRTGSNSVVRGNRNCNQKSCRDFLLLMSLAVIKQTGSRL